MTKQYMVIAGIIGVAAVSGAFYGGMQYEKGVVARQANARDLTSGNRGGATVNGQNGQRGAGPNGAGMMRRGGPNGGGFVLGEILSKDDKSLTLKTPDGGSTIVYFSPTTVVRKAEVGSLSDLATAEQVTVNGKSNPDGSIAADTVQITPPKGN